MTGTRIIRSGMVTPVPTTAVQAAELQSMSAGPMFDSLVQLPPFFANQAPEQVNGGQNSGGSNLNLRGAGLNRTLVLLDGRRVVPTNRFGAVDVAMFPEELVHSVEVVTGGASASYGTDAVAGVVNFMLDTDFEGFKGHAQMGETTYGDGETYEAGFAFGFGIGERGHLIGSIEKFNVDPISDFAALQERSFFNNVARVTNPATTGPANLVRPNVSPTNWNQTGIINHAAIRRRRRAGGAAAARQDRVQSRRHVTPLVFSGVGARRRLRLPARATRDFGSDVDNEVAAGNERETVFLHYEHELSDNLTCLRADLARPERGHGSAREHLVHPDLGAAPVRGQRVSAREHRAADRGAPAVAADRRRHDVSAVRGLRAVRHQRRLTAGCPTFARSRRTS